MRCRVCGFNTAKGAKFCSQCGARLDDNQNTERLRCKECGGTMKVEQDESRTVLVCPFCQATELLDEADSVTIQRIRSNTYKEVEMEKLRHEERKERRKEARAQAAEQKKKEHTGKYSKLAIVAFVLETLSATAALAYISEGEAGRGVGFMIAAAALFVSGFGGRRNAYGKTSKRHKILAAVGCLLFFLTVGMDGDIPPASKEQRLIPSITVDVVTDKEQGIYCYPVRDYVSRNAATIGRVSGAYRVDDYDCAELRIVFIARDGEYLSPADENQLREYVVYAQSLPAGSTLAAVADRSGDMIYSSIADYQNYEEILLYVHRVGETAPAAPDIPAAAPTLDRHAYPIRNYVGRNAASVGESNLAGIADAYGHGWVKIIFSAADGTYVDMKDLRERRQYRVIAQDIAPDTVMTYGYHVFRGEGESSLVEYQSHQEINLTVEKLDDAVIQAMPLVLIVSEKE